MVRYCNQNDNINIGNKLDTYKKGQEQEQVKTFRYCYKCLKDFEEPSIIPFCCDFCRNEFYAEERKEMDSCYREWSGE